MIKCVVSLVMDTENHSKELNYIEIKEGHARGGHVEIKLTNPDRIISILRSELIKALETVSQ